MYRPEVARIDEQRNAEAKIYSATVALGVPDTEGLERWLTTGPVGPQGVIRLKEAGSRLSKGAAKETLLDQLTLIAETGLPVTGRFINAAALSVNSLEDRVVVSAQDIMIQAGRISTGRENRSRAMIIAQ
jgi:hypothetical protein